MRLSIIIVLVAWLQTAQAAGDCAGSDVRLQVLGSGGPELNDDRASTSYLVWRGDRALVLVDLGAGAALHFERSGAEFADLAAIALTHLHADHAADLPALVKGGYFSARTRSLPVFGPAGNALMPATSRYVDALFSRSGAFPYLSDHLPGGDTDNFTLEAVDVPIEPRGISRYTLEPELTLAAVPVHHGPVAAVAWRVDVGSCSVSFSGDMSGRYGTLPELARNSDLLVMHNAVPESAGDVAVQLHMRPSRIGELAAEAKPRAVLLSHRMRRTLDKEQETLREIRRYYDGPVSFADDLAVVAP